MEVEIEIFYGEGRKEKVVRITRSIRIFLF